MHSSSFRSNWPWLGLIATLAVLFYFPVLFQQQTQIHAEGVSLGIALMHMLSSALHGDDGLLWTTAIYGGHPIFAEGQGGFANPLHLLLACWLPPIQAYNINQFLSMLLGGLGAFGMCRAVHCGRAASTFAALALAFSTLWIGGVNNLAVGSTMAWIPWVLWAMTNWLQRADYRSAGLFGVAVALMVLSGYPQLVHGLLIYMTIFLAVQLLSPSGRASVWPRRAALAATLGMAIAFSIALSAVQWLPLLELAGESHRSEGISIIPQDSSTTEAFLRGFLYTFANPERYPDISAGSGSVYFTVAGSLLVCLVFSSLVFFQRSPAVTGHLLATLVLFILGFGVGGTPIFRILYELHLIPGLHSFRVSFPYLYVALAGFALLTAMALDRLSAVTAIARADIGQSLLQLSVRQTLVLLLWLAFWLIALSALHVEGVFTGQYIVAAAWLLLCGGGLVLGYRQALPAIAVLLLAVEIILYRIDSYDFGAAELISKPASVQALERDGKLQDFKFLDRSYAATYSFIHPKSPHVPQGLQKMLSSVTPAANALWGLSSLSGNLALELQRRALANPVLDEELSPGNGKTPGLRLIDFASARYITVGQQFAVPGFDDVYTNSDLGVRMVENVHARPRFQAFRAAEMVSSLDEALAAVRDLDDEILIIEGGGAPVPPITASTEGRQSWRLLEDRSDRYQLEIQASSPFWMFISDTNYPGWNAYLDGARAPLYSAQVLGKAVLVPGGEHSLTFVFEPASFRLGLGISAVGLFSLLLVLGLPYFRRARQ